MAAEKKVLGFIDASRKVRRPPLVGMQFLHQRPMRLSDLVEARSRLKPQDLVGFFFRHYARLRTSTRPRVSVAVSVFTPAGKPAIKICL